MTGTLFDLEPPAERSARISPDGRYRYELSRRWDPGPVALWVMLNPSTADADTDDPTIRRVAGFSRRWGFGGLRVVNLFAYRSTDPDHLLEVDDPVGPENPATLRRLILTAPVVVGAWGAHPAAAGEGAAVAGLAAALGRRIDCLGTTKDGAPRHPLYMPNGSTLEPWSPR